MATKTKYTITYGGWYQRTTLHLSEIYDLFAQGKSYLNLDSTKLTKFKQDLDFTKVTREVGALEYIHATNSQGIEVLYYEDGLYCLSLTTTNITTGRDLLIHYYQDFFSPALAYIFPLGAPTPKILAQIKTTHPIVISTPHLSQKEVEAYGQIYSRYQSAKLSVYKTPDYIFIVGQSPNLSELIELQIFFREFKDQLQRYLNIHREVWEQISDIKERGSIRGSEVDSLRSDLDSSQKTINLISSRLNQMKSYIRTRSSIAHSPSLEEKLLNIFQYKFETLGDTHSYIVDVWKMTSDYVATAIQVINEIKSQSTKDSLNSLRLITTIGVLSGIFGYLSKDSFPQFTLIGIWYFIVLILITWLINQIISTIFQHLSYRLKFSSLSLKK